MAGRGSLRKNITNKFNSNRDHVVAKTSNTLKTGDARLKIIQKNRSKMMDARDRLAQMAKKTDARTKLLKLRQIRKGISTLNMDIVQPVGKTILKKTDRNGKISLSTNKNTLANAQNDINLAIRKELGLVTNRKKITTVRPTNKVQGTKQIKTSKLNLRRTGLNETLTYNRPLQMDAVYSRRPPIIQRTIQNDTVREIPCEIQYNPVDHNLYSWRRSETSALSRTDLRKQSVQLISKNSIPTIDLTNMDWRYCDPNIKSIKMSPYFIDDEIDDSSPPRHTSQQIKTGIHARLDTPSTTQSQGIFSRSKTKVVVPVGHRIVVSNLQPTVTQDDIRELFEDVGELLISRLVRPGTAEVIYKNLKDAQKAVDTYHNRQLDGQPMKCLLVNKRPINNPTAPAVRTAKTITGVLRTNGGILKKKIVADKNAMKLVPDISTIHKVLFHNQ